MQLLGINKPEKFFLGFLTLVTLLAVIVPLVFVVNPQQQRGLQYDQQRIDRMQMVASEITSYHQEFEVLPANLTFLPTQVKAVDPETSSLMGYSILTDTSYNLCFTFSLNSSEATGYQYKAAPIIQDVSYPRQPDFNHSAGYDCITFYVTPKTSITIFPTYLENQPEMTPTDRLPE